MEKSETLSNLFQKGIEDFIFLSIHFSWLLRTKTKSLLYYVTVFSALTVLSDL